jgi:hypothetical protein
MPNHALGHMKRLLVLTAFATASCTVGHVRHDVEATNLGSRDLWVTELSWDGTYVAPGYLRSKSTSGVSDLHQPLPERTFIKWCHAEPKCGQSFTKEMEVRGSLPNELEGHELLVRFIFQDDDSVVLKFMPRQ